MIASQPDWNRHCATPAQEATAFGAFEVKAVLDDQ